MTQDDDDFAAFESVTILLDSSRVAGSLTAKPFLIENSFPPTPACQGNLDERDVAERSVVAAGRMHGHSSEFDCR